MHVLEQIGCIVTSDVVAPRTTPRRPRRSRGAPLAPAYMKVTVDRPPRGTFRRVSAQHRQEGLLVIDARLWPKAEILDQGERSSGASTSAIFCQPRSGSTPWIADAENTAR